ncbi:hypothetical protein EYF80_033703 [Liparis tanakae]|uniref:Uncharacterized protein n=1 Tax=Liparis tanakae TaxID=230148 RepID=A0A4Z2GTL9_9TELE|nr:hypothetical protein EYF80_033703 [Liparis tanakae]
MQASSFWLIEDRCHHLSARRGAELPVMVQRYGRVLNCEMTSRTGMDGEGLMGLDDVHLELKVNGAAASQRNGMVDTRQTNINMKSFETDPSLPATAKWTKSKDVRVLYVILPQLKPTEVKLWRLCVDQAVAFQFGIDLYGGGGEF